MLSLIKKLTRDKEADVSSAVMKHVHYEPSRMALQITFQNGNIYEYGSVDSKVFKEMNSAESKGKFFIKNIRGIYPFIRIS